MEIIRYINGKRVPGAMPELRVGNPGLREILKTLEGRVLRGAETVHGTETRQKA